MKLVPNNITLERVKNSNYWELIARIVWNHYREERYQDNSMVSFQEEWYGKQENGSSNSDDWNNPDYTEKDYVRTLGDIKITFTRTDYVTHIYINVETGNIMYFGVYTDKEKTNQPCHHSAQAVQLMNWMLEHNLLSVESSNPPLILNKPV